MVELLQFGVSLLGPSQTTSDSTDLNNKHFGSCSSCFFNCFLFLNLFQSDILDCSEPSNSLNEGITVCLLQGWFWFFGFNFSSQGFLILYGQPAAVVELFV